MDYKVLFTGPAGAGKTTAITAVSEVTTLNTDVLNTDLEINKLTTTVGLDYGEMTLSNGDKLRLYGTPGQTRFDFMWDILSRGALGLIILIDNRKADPLADLDVYLNGFKNLINSTSCVVAISHMGTHPEPDVEQFSEHLNTRGILCPVLQTDVREARHVAELLELLMLQLEAKQDMDTYED
ncbi:ATP/GTP-binding protein [Undibacterium sp. CY18W]|uniref:ATP/GTP-binding protein n=1 Tax=Undibacterium hunanense TaxID=2762292 RepID=A0ABR6ZU24_9BURK|nr:ATP/GTP-binding protein [Undibacterium hunanense]MBC3919357.1 ATP/GTP-binding protein [Undibacterium hunanense]